MKPQPKGSITIPTVFAALGAIAIGAVVVTLVRDVRLPEEGVLVNHNANAVACTQEAKLCPDGSAVGRTGPNCEFAPCPGTSGDANRNSSSNAANRFSFDSAKVGDRVAGMVILSIGRFTDNAPAGPTNRKVEFSGRVTLTGRVQSSRGVGYTVRMGALDPSSSASLPQLSGDECCDGGFAFTNEEFALSAFPEGTSSRQSVVIDGYTINHFPSEVTNESELVSVAAPPPAWRTYANTQEGFSVEYPPDWAVDLSNSSPTDALRGVAAFRSQEFSAANSHLGEIAVTRFRNTNDLSLEEYWNQANDLGVTTSPEQSTIGEGGTYGVIRLRAMSNPARFPSPRTDILVKVPGKIFTFSIQNINGNYEAQLGTFNDLVQSFHFVDPTATWITFTDTRYGFAFRYPPFMRVLQVQDNNGIVIRVGVEGSRNGDSFLVYNLPETTDPYCSVRLKFDNYPFVVCHVGTDADLILSTFQFTE